VACALLMAALAACAARNPWTNPSVPKTPWESDWAMCKNRASARAGLDRTPYYDTDRRIPNPFEEYDRQSKAAEVNDAVDSCMIGLGYLPTRKRQ
jgi:hypothetical protein